MSNLTELVNTLFPKKQEKFAEAKAANGEMLEAESFEPGNAVFLLTSEGERVPLPEGEYELEDGSVIMVDAEGVIAEFRPAEATEEEAKAAEPEAPKAEAMEEVKEPVYATVEDLEDFKKEILAGFSTMSEHLKAHKAEKVELSEATKAELDGLKKKMHKPTPLGKEEKVENSKVKSIDRKPARRFENPTLSRVKANNEKFVNTSK